jgi:anti-sigma B factor antagonist
MSRRLRVQTKARLRPDPAKLVVTVGPAVARHEMIVGLPEEIDIRNAASVAEQLISAVSSSSVVIADMTATIFCDCAGARAIVRAYDRAADSGAELRVAITAPLVRRIFGLIGVDNLVDIYPSVAAARGGRPDDR